MDYELVVVTSDTDPPLGRKITTPVLPESGDLFMIGVMEFRVGCRRITIGRKEDPYFSYFDTDRSVVELYVTPIRNDVSQVLREEYGFVELEDVERYYPSEDKLND